MQKDIKLTSVEYLTFTDELNEANKQTHISTNTIVCLTSAFLFRSSPLPHILELSINLIICMLSYNYHQPHHVFSASADQNLANSLSTHQDTLHSLQLILLHIDPLALKIVDSNEDVKICRVY